jgi:tetratricopeptide (TPR) repeat protein
MTETKNPGESSGKSILSDNLSNRLSGQQKGVMVALLLILVIAFVQIRIDDDRKAAGLTASSLKSGSFTALELLGGLKTASAAFLWIKIDRIHDTYYGNLNKEAELIPMYRLVTWLNPHLDEAYYVGSYMLYKFGKPGEGWKFNQEGLRMNPRSAKLELNAAQFILFERGNRKLTAKDYEAAIEHLKRALTFGGMEDDEFLIAYHDLKLAYENLGLKDEASAVEKELKAFSAELDQNNALQQ